jgi:hypothetical protein
LDSLGPAKTKQWWHRAERRAKAIDNEELLGSGLYVFLPNYKYHKRGMSSAI